MNNLTISGKIVSEMRYDTEKEIVKASLVSTRTVGRRGGERRDIKDLFTLVAYGSVAYNMSQRLGKGDDIVITGVLQSCPNGCTEIVVEKFDMLCRQ